MERKTMQKLFIENKEGDFFKKNTQKKERKTMQNDL
jgi:hypothetical protein